MLSVSCLACSACPVSHAQRVLSRMLSVSSVGCSACPVSHAQRVLSRMLSVSCLACSACPVPHAQRVLSRMLSVSCLACSACPLSPVQRVLCRLFSVSSVACSACPLSPAQRVLSRMLSVSCLACSAGWAHCGVILFHIHNSTHDTQRNTHAQTQTYTRQEASTRDVYKLFSRFMRLMQCWHVLRCAASDEVRRGPSRRPEEPHVLEM